MDEVFFFANFPSSKFFSNHQKLQLFAAMDCQPNCWMKCSFCYLLKLHANFWPKSLELLVILINCWLNKFGNWCQKRYGIVINLKIQIFQRQWRTTNGIWSIMDQNWPTPFLEELASHLFLAPMENSLLFELCCRFPKCLQMESLPILKWNLTHTNQIRGKNCG